MIHEFSHPETRERVLVNDKESCTVVMLGTRDVSVFDRDGRLLYAAREGTLLRRGLDGRLLKLDRPPVFVEPEEVRSIYRTVDEVSRIAPVEARERLSEVLRCDAAALDKTAARFREIYGTVPILPPDQYDSIYLQVAVGCRTNRCTFCTLYRDRTYRARSLEDFRGHLRDVLDFLGRDVPRRKSIFLGDANALSVPMKHLGVMVEEARRAIPGREIHCFADATLHRTVKVDDLSGLGLARVTLGLETAHEPLYKRLHKPGTLEGFARSVERVKASGTRVGITVLIGLGAPVSDTVEFLSRLPLGAGDYVYLSPLQGGGAPPPGVEETETEEFRKGLAPMLQRCGARAIPYDLSRFVY